MSTPSTESPPDRPVKKSGGWKSWLPKVILTLLGLVLAYFIFSYMATNFGGFEQGVQSAFSMPLIWTVAAIAAAIFAIAVYPLTAIAAIPHLGYVPAFVDRQGGFAIATTIPFGGGPIAVGMQYAILARYGVSQRLAAAAVAADALWTYLMTFGAPGVALTLLWIFERRAVTGDSCGAIPCETLDIIVLIAGVICLVSMASSFQATPSGVEPRNLPIWPSIMHRTNFVQGVSLSAQNLTQATAVLYRNSSLST